MVEKDVDDEIVHLLCYQTRKTASLSGQHPRGAPIVIVAHTTLEWARRNSRATGRDRRCLEEVQQRVFRLLRLGGDPKSDILESKVITWRQCQVTKPVSSKDSCMLLASYPPLVLAGDYFTESTFGGCLASAFAAAASLAEALLHVTGSHGKRAFSDGGASQSSKRRRQAWR